MAYLREIACELLDYCHDLPRYIYCGNSCDEDVNNILCKKQFTDEYVEYLVSNDQIDILEKINLSTQDITRDNNILIRIAAKHGSYLCAKYLVEHGADVTTCDNYAIRIISFSNNNRYMSDFIKLLVDNGADINSDNGYPIKYAAYKKNVCCLNLFIEMGANIHVDDDLPLRIAIHDTVIFDILLERSANINSDNGYILNYCLSKHLPVEHIKYLVDNGADLKLLNSTTISNIITYGNLDVIKYLINNGVNFCSINNSGYENLNNYIETINCLEYQGVNLKMLIALLYEHIRTD